MHFTKSYRAGQDRTSWREDVEQCTRATKVAVSIIHHHHHQSAKHGWQCVPVVSGQWRVHAGRDQLCMTNRARRSSSRPTAWPPARAWSSRYGGGSPRGGRHDARRQAWATPAREWSSRSSWKARRRASSSCVDGTHVLPLATSQDHKRLRTADTGPEHRRHGRVLAGARRDAGHARARDARSHPPDVAGMAKDGMPLYRLPLRRADDRRRRRRRRRSNSTAAWATRKRNRSCCA